MVEIEVPSAIRYLDILCFSSPCHFIASRATYCIVLLHLNIFPTLPTIPFYFQYVRANELDIDLRVEFLSYLFWFAAHEAIEMGLWETGWCILRVIRKGMSRKSALEENHFPITSSEIKYQELVFKLVAGDQSALLMLDEILSNVTQDTSHHISSLNPSFVASSSCSDNIHASNSSNFIRLCRTDEMIGEGDENHLINPSSLTFKGTEESKGSKSRFSEVASSAMRNLGRLSVSMASANPIGISEDIVTDDDLVDIGSAPSGRFSCNSVRGSNSSASKYACGEDATFDEDFVPPPTEVVPLRSYVCYPLYP